jgi:hypothetical protein
VHPCLTMVISTLLAIMLHQCDFALVAVVVLMIALYVFDEMPSS